jgi:magnesium-transporting ATPase (P-type)
LLHTDIQSGISGTPDDIEVSTPVALISWSDRAQKRQYFYGRNAIPTPKSRTFVQLMLDAVNDTVLFILIGAAIISLIFGSTLSSDTDTDWIEGTYACSRVNEA